MKRAKKVTSFLLSFTMVLSFFTIAPLNAEAEEMTDQLIKQESVDNTNDVINYKDEAICPKDDSCPLTRFTDTDKNEWYHDGVHRAIEKGIMNGTGENTFEPLTATSRAMIVTMLWRMDGSPKADRSITFKDVPDGQWYTEAIRWAAANDIVNGYDEDTFGTNDSVTREQLATILYRSVKANGQGFTGKWTFPLNFDDADQVSEWADEALHWMTMNGIIQGMNEKELSPQGDAVRAQVATMLMRLDLLDQSQDQVMFLEMSDYQNWAKEEGYPSGLIEAQGVDGINQDFFHTSVDSENYSSGKIVIGDSRCCQMGIYEQRKGKSDFATYAVWGGHFAKDSNPPLMTEKLQSEVEACFQEQIRSFGKSVIYIFATVNDYDFTENEKNDAYIKDTVSAAEFFASMSYDYKGSTYHLDVVVIGFDGGPATGTVLRYPAEEFNRYCDDYNQKLRSAVSDSEILKGNPASFTTVPEIVGGKASFITDGLHYSDNTLAAIIRYIVNH